MIIETLLSGPIERSFLYVAAVDRDTETIERYMYYLDEGYDDIFTPLQHAIIDNNFPAMQFLKQMGACFNTVNMHFMSPLHIAAIFGEPWLLQYLFEEGAEVEWVDVQNKTALHYAIAFKKVANAIRLTELGPSEIDTPDMCLATPLIEACKYDLTEVVRVLMEHGAHDTDVLEARGNEYSCLHHAAHNGNPEILEMLLQTDPYVDVRNRLEYSPLHTALSRGWTHVADMLIDAGADPDLEDEDGETGLFYGVLNDDYALVKASLERGADPMKRNVAGKVPLDLMRPSGQNSFYELLVSAMMQRMNPAPVVPRNVIRRLGGV